MAKRLGYDPKRGKPGYMRKPRALDPVTVTAQDVRARLTAWPELTSAGLTSTYSREYRALRRRLEETPVERLQEIADHVVANYTVNGFVRDKARAGELRTLVAPHINGHPPAEGEVVLGALLAGVPAEGTVYKGDGVRFALSHASFTAARKRLTELAERSQGLGTAPRPTGAADGKDPYGYPL